MTCQASSSTPDVVDLIPIYFRVPFRTNKEIISGYLEKKKVDFEKRFFGHFVCISCDISWTSGKTWQSYTQECRACKNKIWPYKVYHLIQSQKQSAGHHRSELCEKCQKLGYDCLTGGKLHTSFSKFNKKIRRTKFDICYDKQFELVKYKIKLEPNFIRGLYTSIYPNLGPLEKKEFLQGLHNAKFKWREKKRSDLVAACSDVIKEISK